MVRAQSLFLEGDVNPDHLFVTTRYVNQRVQSDTPHSFSDSQELATTMWVRSRLGHPDPIPGWDDSTLWATTAWFEAFLAENRDITPPATDILQPAVAVAPRGLYFVSVSEGLPSDYIAIRDSFVHLNSHVFQARARERGGIHQVGQGNLDGRCDSILGGR